MGTVANIGSIEDILMVCVKVAAAEARQIDIIYSGEPSAQQGGTWEFRVPTWTELRGSHTGIAFDCELEMTYWISRSGCIEERSPLRIKFPLGIIQEKLIKREVLKMIDKINGRVSQQSVEAEVSI